MKDWKAEYDKLRGELSAVRQDLERHRYREEERYRKDQDVRDRFKELLIDVLGGSS